jgi:uncharacterized SAM-binding protein YcdF (DUF218 family)
VAGGKRRRSGTKLLVGMIRFTTSVAGAAVVLWAAGLGLVVLAGSRPALRPADAIVVLGAAQYNGRPSPVYKARLDHALDLYQRGLAPRIIFTGGTGPGDTISEGEVGRLYALQHGVPNGAIMVDREGMTSRQSVNAAALLMRGLGLRSALMVSDPFHMLRLEVLARREGLRPYRAPTPMTRIDRSSDAWWTFVLRESVLFPAAVVYGGN